MGARSGYGGGEEGERRGYGALPGLFRCAILAQNPLLASIVNLKSLSYNSPFLCVDAPLSYPRPTGTTESSFTSLHLMSVLHTMEPSVSATRNPRTAERE